MIHRLPPPVARATRGAALIVTLGAGLCLPGCHGTPPAPPPATPAGPASSPTRWVHPQAPQDATLLVLPARTVGDPSSRGVVAPVLAGRVEVLHVRPGDTVKVGDPIAELAAPEAIEAAAAVEAARRQLRPVKQRLAELKRLRTQGLAAADTVFALTSRQVELETTADRARATLRAAGLGGDGARSVLERGRMTLTSPVSGVVRAVTAQLGQVRGPGDGPLAEIVGMGAVRVEARLPRPLPPGARPVFAPLQGEPVPLNPVPVATTPALDASGIVAWFAPADDRPLPHGLRGDLRLAPASKGVWEVPQAAVVIEDGQANVARRDGQGAVTWVPVEVLSGAGASALVRGALTGEDDVAADGRKARALAEEAATPATAVPSPSAPASAPAEAHP